MELNFGENIKRLRRSRDLTQEALADALGVSSQSVSKWECAYGYPDITQLPAIANYFGVTIDELLNNDKNSREAEFEKYREAVNKYDYGCDEQIELMREYCRRYPDDMQYGIILNNVLTNVILGDVGRRSKYYPLFKSLIEKLLEYPEYRNKALCNAITACDENELEQYLKMAPESIEYTRRNMLLDRYMCHDDTNNQLIHQGLAFIENMVQQLDIRYPDSLGPENKTKYHKCILSMLRSFSDDGTIPDGWLAIYAYKQLVLSACLFGCGNKSEGEKEFCSAIDKLHRFYNLPDEFLDMGGILCGNLKMNRDWNMTVDIHGISHKLYGTNRFSFFSDPDYMLNLLTNPRWAWFDSARDEEYYKNAVEWLSNLVNKKDE